MPKTVKSEKIAAAPSFEELVAQIEQQAAKLEQGELSLADALQCYEQATANLRQAYQIINQAEARVKILTENAGELADWQEDIAAAK
ncbi:MAG: exodeoxyribonuclease VII small subunit [Planctomycetota bacterium]|jgi:exodeoxyribonuclease VII small subunit|nr:exodeoxyribonuclease VII small subunit [Planctomycetota bacterium]